VYQKRYDSKPLRASIASAFGFLGGFFFGGLGGFFLGGFFFGGLAFGGFFFGFFGGFFFGALGFLGFGFPGGFFGFGFLGGGFFGAGFGVGAVLGFTVVSLPFEEIFEVFGFRVDGFGDTLVMVTGVDVALPATVVSLLDVITLVFGAFG
jgi:hypothetical protein